MKANELRIGNYVYDTLGKVNKIDLEAITYIVKEPHNQVKPIPLTEEWLLKFGFIYHESIKHWVKNWGINGAEFIKFDEYYNLFSFQLGKDNYKVIDIGVHQLQNLWFVLTGEEII
jgi:hypothetical protein